MEAVVVPRSLDVGAGAMQLQPLRTSAILALPSTPARFKTIWSDKFSAHSPRAASSSTQSTASALGSGLKASGGRTTRPDADILPTVLRTLEAGKTSSRAFRAATEVAVTTLEVSCAPRRVLGRELTSRFSGVSSALYPTAHRLEQRRHRSSTDAIGASRRHQTALARAEDPSVGAQAAAAGVAVVCHPDERDGFATPQECPPLPAVHGSLRRGTQQARLSVIAGPRVKYEPRRASRAAEVHAKRAYTRIYPAPPVILPF
ncbi:hypothetical protein FA95DRAFT_584672 [Auriscalpium vulgare]|uniref:Uncharacterized protein n=1 Tax=Auriscalpium vulgare TaxID=40419 RepID=A0ACB8RE41_9AGAM|nr:hypothetical protein FA95DRAFT_584672 [Auriscalpium vulgare]